MRIAIYDLDRTLTARATFTPFLLFAARRLAPLRLLLAPVWVLAMLYYKLGLCSRTALKAFGMRLMLGEHARGDLAGTAQAFSQAHIARGGWRQDIIRALEQDRAAGYRPIIATAAFEFYAAAFAKLLRIDTVIGTRWDGDGIPGGNCYGEEKLARVEAWLEGEGASLAAAETRFYSDSFADAPLLDRVKDPVFVTDSEGERERAAERGWRAP
ncbi:haloacid dehalogenase-like hydrolase [Paraurantiacibacter namhicola]|uniref:Haloacid dehalogenase-like hydrolase n=1 Tax=Paraurantiacibacter namhicola TaxID=645517 RepID=A0A1C7D9G3_9SPHN|nr:haloacid dehalogenase-like hydrolase [Paraurantiacibacter namhicola]ANU08126.1 haloacid dehalogenase-like hydrolase [Paraurantiacibacter namhicola]